MAGLLLTVLSAHRALAAGETFTPESAPYAVIPADGADPGARPLAPGAWVPATDGLARAPSLGHFPGDLAASAGRLFSLDALVPATLGLGLAGLARGNDADRRVRDWAGSRRRLRPLGDAGAVVGSVPVTAAAFGGLLAASQLSHNPRFRSLGYDLGQGYVLNQLTAGALKLGVRRLRPNGESRRSFPSGHTSNAFMTATVIEAHYGARVGVPAFAAAGLVGLSRVEKNAHYLTDVVAGAVLGYVSGRAVVGGRGRAGRRLELSPIAADDGGRGLAVHLTF